MSKSLTRTRRGKLGGNTKCFPLCLEGPWAGVGWGRTGTWQSAACSVPWVRQCDRWCNASSCRALNVLLEVCYVSGLMGSHWSNLSWGIPWSDLHVIKIAVWRCSSHRVLRNVLCQDTVNGELINKWTRRKKKLKLPWKGIIKLMRFKTIIEQEKDLNISKNITQKRF